MVAVDSQGASGGIFTLWNPTKMQLIKSKRTIPWLATNFITLDMHQETYTSQSTFRKSNNVGDL